MTSRPKVPQNLPSAIFVTGTDTGVGKTYFAKLLATYLRGQGFKVAIQKWIQSGKPEDHPGCSVYKFKTPASPHLAAEIEGKTISADKIKRAFRAAAEKNDYVIVEGTGGALVPYSHRKLVIDIVKELKLPVIIVAQNKLGVINHTLLTIEALKRRKIKILGVVYNQPPEGQKVQLTQAARRAKTSQIEKLIQKDNPRVIEQLSGIPSFMRQLNQKNN
ncbi:MAG: dethiobiotin synthase [Candidatus Margulisiibacteriota bacterium]